MVRDLTIIVLILITFVSAPSSSQTFANDSLAITPKRQNDLTRLLSLIKEDRIVELATKWIAYPLGRLNPVPDIKTPDEFILYYHSLFDPDYKAKLLSTEYSVNNTIDFDEYKSRFGLFHGDIWLDLDGRIAYINHQSTADSLLQYRLQTECMNTIHASVKPWKRNVLVWESDKFLMRVDELDSGYRYVAWSKPKVISDKPDIILFDGVIERQGTMGGWTYTFKNKDWTYVLDDAQMGESQEVIGLFINVFHKDVLKSSSRCKEVK